MTATSARIIELQSYTLSDWVVTQAERRQIITLLCADRDMPATITDLHKAGQLYPMLAMFVDRGWSTVAGDAVELVEVLGAGAGRVAGAMVDGWRGWPPRLKHLFRLSRDLHESFRRMGSRVAARSYSPGLAPNLVSAAADAPFTGAGATGVPGTELSVPRLEQLQLWRKNAAAVRRWSNPLPGDLFAYLDTLSIRERMAQARHLLVRPIHSVVPFSYRQGRPSRADVCVAAARAHRLSPALLAAFILAEQRDQSRNEDAKDYTAATNPIAQGNTSIGLGQVVVSTARKHDLFADLMIENRASLSHNQIAELLVSEEFNIFAVARYIRITANAAVRHSARTLPETVRLFPGINFALYGRPSEEWPHDNIYVLGSEYTSSPWDDVLRTGWGGFVFEAYVDMTQAGIF